MKLVTTNLLNMVGWTWTSRGSPETNHWAFLAFTPILGKIPILTQFFHMGWTPPCRNSLDDQKPSLGIFRHILRWWAKGVQSPPQHRFLGSTTILSFGEPGSLGHPENTQEISTKKSHPPEASIEGRLSFDPPQRANSVSLGQAGFTGWVGADGGFRAPWKEPKRNGLGKGGTPYLGGSSVIPLSK